ncbi:uncharacterized protein LOC129748460 [Uranotaenia lowii]|uniref:uncharacterized protein LOC129748460 n=1 Tax=Uranotaenia lowii TaxID=190385 RepID=UPI00247B1F8E|nr:uncharacterized protein LOC129748460 [Uranotaenia lowii]
MNKTKHEPVFNRSSPGAYVFCFWCVISVNCVFVPVLFLTFPLFLLRNALSGINRRSHIILSTNNLMKSKKTSTHANKASEEMSTRYGLWWNVIPDIVSGSESGSQTRSEVVALYGLLLISFRCVLFKVESKKTSSHANEASKKKSRVYEL